jgi:hypothetical protein
MPNLKKKVLELLESTRFPICRTRPNVSTKPSAAFALGEVNYRGQKSLGGRTRGPSRYNKKFPELFQAIKELIEYYHPDFEYTTIQVNKNVQSKGHVDQNNVGPSIIIALGDFDGGELMIEGKPSTIKNRFKKFDGRLGHWVAPFKGTRYSLVFFTHTFKPPCRTMRGLVVKKDGLYKDGECIKKYKLYK